MHEHATKFLEELGVEVLLGARADMTTLDNSSDNKNRKLKTLDGRTVEAEIIVSFLDYRVYVYASFSLKSALLHWTAS